MTWIIGIQGPQGCGKSTMASALVEEWGRAGVRATAVSIDDFYLTHAEQEALAARHDGNPYLRYRGYPGTHDVALGRRTIDALASLGDAQSTAVPVYDKSAHRGRGDRAPGSAWRRVTGPIDVLVVEGWMLGFTPVDADAGAGAFTVDPALEAPNRYLEAYRAWHERLDAFVHMHVDSLDAVVHWRMDSERARRERGEPALSDEEARDYIERFLPAYRLWVPQLRAHPPCSELTTIELAEDRRLHPPDALQRILLAAPQG
jgi:D-glycerate 3-kinase